MFMKKETSRCGSEVKYDVNRMSTGNVRGVNGTANREEVVDVFRKGIFEFLALIETKLK